MVKKEKRTWKQWLIDQCTKRPKQDFWKSLCITLILVNVISPTFIVYLTMFNTGLVVGDSVEPEKMHGAFERATEKGIEAQLKVMESLYVSGQRIGSDNLWLGIVASYALSWMVFGIYAALVGFSLYFLRWPVSWMVRKYWKVKA